MDNNKVSEAFYTTVVALSKRYFEEPKYICQRHGENMPSGEMLAKVIELVRSVVFPGYFGDSVHNSYTGCYKTGVMLEQIYTLLCKQVEAGLCFSDSDFTFTERQKLAREIALDFILYLPSFRNELLFDVDATYYGDPSATSYAEVISCYPVVKVMCNYRMANYLYAKNVPLIPRILTELAHSETGIDIHPAAKIGRGFTVDHGTGVVIGETCVIGDNVKLYQGVTLGAKSFPLDAVGNPIKGIPRHPILGNNVIVYANATILGRVTIGNNVIVGGNVWLTESVPDGACILSHHYVEDKN